MWPFMFDKFLNNLIRQPNLLLFCVLHLIRSLKNCSIFEDDNDVSDS